MATKRIILASGTSWTVPADWNSASNSIEVIGGGGGGAAKTATNNTGGAGGRGGHYARKNNLALTPGNSVSYQIGTGGATNTAGGDTWFSSTSTVLAKGGTAPASNSQTAPNAASGDVGDVTYVGGAGANGASASGGGGGAAGPTGAGGDASTTTGGTGSNGDGGAGGVHPATAGSAGEQWTATEGSPSTAGAGGGGGGATSQNVGGAGGAYGAGGGGGRRGTANRNGGAGAPGVIVITWEAAETFYELETASSTSVSALSATLGVILAASGAVVSDSALAANLDQGQGLSGSITSVSAATAELDEGTPVPDNEVLTGSVSSGSTLAGHLYIPGTDYRFGAVYRKDGDLRFGSVYHSPVTDVFALLGAVRSSTTLTGALTGIEEPTGGYDPITGQITSQTTVSGDLNATPQLSGAAQSASLLSAALNKRQALSGTIPGLFDFYGHLDAAPQLTGSTQTTSLITAGLTSLQPLSGSVVSAANIEAQLLVDPVLTGAITSVFGLTGTLYEEEEPEGPYEGSIYSWSALSGSLSSTQVISGAFSSTSALSGSLSTQVDQRRVLYNTSPTDVGATEHPYVSWADDEIELTALDVPAHIDVYFKVITTYGESTDWFGPVDVGADYSQLSGQSISSSGLAAALDNQPTFQGVVSSASQLQADLTTQVVQKQVLYNTSPTDVGATEHPYVSWADDEIELTALDVPAHIDVYFKVITTYGESTDWFGPVDVGADYSQLSGQSISTTDLAATLVNQIDLAGQLASGSSLAAVLSTQVDQKMVLVNTSPSSVFAVAHPYVSWTDTEITLDDIDLGDFSGDLYFKVITSYGVSTAWFGPITLSTEQFLPLTGAAGTNSALTASLTYDVGLTGAIASASTIFADVDLQSEPSELSGGVSSASILTATLSNRVRMTGKVSSVSALTSTLDLEVDQRRVLISPNPDGSGAIEHPYVQWADDEVELAAIDVAGYEGSIYVQVRTRYGIDTGWYGPVTVAAEEQYILWGALSSSSALGGALNTRQNLTAIVASTATLEGVLQGAADPPIEFLVLQDLKVVPALYAAVQAIPGRRGDKVVASAVFTTTRVEAEPQLMLSKLSVYPTINSSKLQLLERLDAA